MAGHRWVVIGCCRIVTCGYYSEKDAARCVNEMLEAVKVITDRLVITFRVSRRHREMYSGHERLSVCLPVPRRIPTLLHGPGFNFGNGTGCPLFVHYGADLQSVHGFRCCGNIAPNAKCQRVLVLALCLVSGIEMLWVARVQQWGLGPRFTVKTVSTVSIKRDNNSRS